jgi:hypothetical protein
MIPPGTVLRSGQHRFAADAIPMGETILPHRFERQWQSFSLLNGNTFAAMPDRR